MSEYIMRYATEKEYNIVAFDVNDYIIGKYIGEIIECKYMHDKVNSVKDVINAEPGFVTIDKMDYAKYIV
ncbi:MAG: hypothetical protein PHD15_06120 [Clostridia bacterium]|nr:hypothetical protein [Clostridia bacterium]MDD4387306.1 hypothetical protein [Clostridia bacterium]